MAWTIEYDRDATQAFKRLDKPIARDIMGYLDAVASLDDPRARGKSLTGNLAGLWLYWVGDYRIICDIYDEDLVIVAVDLGHRSGIYG